MRTVTTEPIITEAAAVNGRRLEIRVHREPTRALSWVAGVTFRSDWGGEGSLTWEVSAADPIALIDVLKSFDPRTRITGIHVVAGGAAPKAMEIRREQLRTVWLGLVERVGRGIE